MIYNLISVVYRALGMFPFDKTILFSCPHEVFFAELKPIEKNTCENGYMMCFSQCNMCSFFKIITCLVEWFIIVTTSSLNLFS